MVEKPQKITCGSRFVDNEIVFYVYFAENDYTDITSNE